MRRAGKRFRTERLELRFIGSQSRQSRLGIIVPRHHQSAVARNRVKRRLREIARLELIPQLRQRTPLDIVVRAAPEAYGATYKALETDLQELARRVMAVG